MTDHQNPSTRFLDRLNELQERIANGETHLLEHYKKELRHCTTQLHRLNDDPELREMVNEALNEQLVDVQLLSDQDLCEQIAITYEANGPIGFVGETYQHENHPSPLNSPSPSPLIEETHGFSILGCLYVLVALVALTIAAGVLMMLFFLPH